MIEFICLFFPTFISLSVLDRIEKKKEKIERINCYAIYNIMINTIALLIVAYFIDFEIIMPKDVFTVVFSIKYLVMASIISFVLPYAINYVKKNFKIQFKRKKIK